MTKEIIEVEGWGKPQPLPQESYEDWVSVEHLLHKYTVPVLAEAIDKHDVQVIDKTGRKIYATDGDENDIYSKAYAKKNLAACNPINSGLFERIKVFEESIDVENNPLDFFGWPKDCLPVFKKIKPHVASTQPKSAPEEIRTGKVNSWVSSAQEIAKSYVEKHKKNDLYPTQNDVSKYVADELRKQSIHGPNGPVSSSYVKRQAIQGDWWKKNKPSR